MTHVIGGFHSWGMAAVIADVKALTSCYCDACVMLTAVRGFGRREKGLAISNKARLYACLAAEVLARVSRLNMALMRPDSGEVWVDQDNVVGMGEQRLSLVRKKLGYLFQNAALFDSLTLYKNPALPLKRLTKKSKDEIDDVIAGVLSDVGLGIDGAKYPSALSGGMRKRAGLARALVLEPKILLADEPSSGLAAALTRRSLGPLRKRWLSRNRDRRFRSHAIPPFAEHT